MTPLSARWWSKSLFVSFSPDNRDRLFFRASGPPADNTVLCQCGRHPPAKYVSVSIFPPPALMLSDPFYKLPVLPRVSIRVLHWGHCSNRDNRPLSETTPLFCRTWKPPLSCFMCAALLFVPRTGTNFHDDHPFIEVAFFLR